ncbi:MAG: methyltransferase domain-containing protein [Geodermatophilaceae bacterium]|nr:methyltransferase domain-containing protein [Geodermatophilaceae bacterium]
MTDLQPESFDLITAFDVLEHIVDDKGAVDELARALAPGGHLLVHVPRDRWLTRSGTVHAVPDEDAWRINSGHVRQGYSPEAMRTLLEGGGLQVLDVQTWLGRWGTFAHEFYERVETPTPLRLLSLPVTDVCAALDRRGGTPEGNTVYAQAIKPRSVI